jgi:hypothetical protein
MTERKQSSQNSEFNNLMISDIRKLIISYALNNIDNVDTNLLRDSIEKVGNAKFELFVNHGSYSNLGPVQNFKIISILRNTHHGITITTSPIKSKSTRIKLNIGTTKLLYKALLSMHGLKGTITVEKDDDNYIATVSNIKLSEYSEVYFPIQEYMMTELSTHFKESKYHRLSTGILSPDRISEIKDLFNV